MPLWCWFQVLYATFGVWRRQSAERRGLVYKTSLYIKTRGSFWISSQISSQVTAELQTKIWPSDPPISKRHVYSYEWRFPLKRNRNAIINYCSHVDPVTNTECEETTKISILQCEHKQKIGSDETERHLLYHVTCFCSWGSAWHLYCNMIIRYHTCSNMDSSPITDKKGQSISMAPISTHNTTPISEWKWWY